MLVSVTGFGSVWRQRLESDLGRRGLFKPAVYYNTTGVMVKSGVRQRPQICGYARFEAVGGFNPNHPAKIIGRVFECAEPSVWMGYNKLLFRRLIAGDVCPEYYLVVADSRINGHFAVGTEGWKSPDTWLLSFSEGEGDQELMLLMCKHSWIESELGRLALHPPELRPWSARLILSARE